jgi:hypothetical protein|tara:strand:+ start:745 stop:1014 length:270 start_codon:yes stop_codon:yes gene_type:complete
MNIQDKMQEIHHKYGVSEKANYEIEKFVEKLIENDRAEQLILHNVSKRYAWLNPNKGTSRLWDEDTHRKNVTKEDIKEAEKLGWLLLEF